MKILILNILLLAASAVLARSEMDSDESSESPLDNRSSLLNGGGGVVSQFSGQASHSVINSNGNSIVVSRRFNSKGEEESYISIASPKIRIDGEYFTCTSLTCPTEAFKCHISSEAIADDLNKMKTIAECQDKDGKILQSNELIEDNPFPRDDPPYSRVADVDRDGSINIQDSNGLQSFTSIRKKLSKEEQEKLNKEIEERTKLFQQQLQQQLDEMNNHFNRVFGQGFPFANRNPFTPGFPFTNSFPLNFPFGNQNFGNPYRTNFDPFFGDDFNYNWPYVSDSFGSAYRPVAPPLPTNRYPSFNPQMLHPNNRIHPKVPVVTKPENENEIETNTKLNDADNELFDTTTHRGVENSVHNYYDKYRYAHSN